MGIVETYCLRVFEVRVGMATRWALGVVAFVREGGGSVVVMPFFPY